MANNSTGRRLWNKGRSGFRGFITVHPWFKLFSFLLAMGMWLWVQREQVIDGLVEVDGVFWLNSQLLELARQSPMLNLPGQLPGSKSSLWIGVPLSL